MPVIGREEGGRLVISYATKLHSTYMHYIMPNARTPCVLKNFFVFC